MASFLFLRGANVGGHRTFRPAELAAALSDLRVESIGAAGTFIVRARITASRLRTTVRSHLPFSAEIMICSDRALLAFADGHLFPRVIPSGARRFVSILGKRPRSVPHLPFDYPAGAQWQVRVVGIEGQFVASLWRRIGTRMIYPNEAVEKRFGVPATTRNWETMMRIADRLRSPHG